MLLGINCNKLYFDCYRTQNLKGPISSVSISAYPCSFGAKNKKRDSNTAQKIELALVPFLARPNLKILYLVLSLL